MKHFKLALFNAALCGANIFFAVYEGVQGLTLFALVATAFCAGLCFALDMVEIISEVSFHDPH